MFRHGKGHAQSILKFSLLYRIECGWTIAHVEKKMKWALLALVLLMPRISTANLIVYKLRRCQSAIIQLLIKFKCPIQSPEKLPAYYYLFLQQKPVQYIKEKFVFSRPVWSIVADPSAYTGTTHREKGGKEIPGQTFRESGMMESRGEVNQDVHDSLYKREREECIILLVRVAH